MVWLGYGKASCLVVLQVGDFMDGYEWMSRTHTHTHTHTPFGWWYGMGIMFDDKGCLVGMFLTERNCLSLRNILRAHSGLVMAFFHARYPQLFITHLRLAWCILYVGTYFLRRRIWTEGTLVGAKIGNWEDGPWWDRGWGWMNGGQPGRPAVPADVHTGCF